MVSIMPRSGVILEIVIAMCMQEDRAPAAGDIRWRDNDNAVIAVTTDVTKVSAAAGICSSSFAPSSLSCSTTCYAINYLGIEYCTGE